MLSILAARAGLLSASGLHQITRLPGAHSVRLWLYQVSEREFPGVGSQDCGATLCRVPALLMDI